MSPSQHEHTHLPSLQRAAIPRDATPVNATPVGARLALAQWDDLWIAGDPTALRPPLVAIVGTRNPDLHGRRMAWELAAGLARANVCVLSGGALGVDACAHTGALECDGRTVVVMPSGFEHAYPARHAPLYARVIDTGGALVTPFRPDTPPARWTFPRRNELLAALCDVLVVVQAPAASGSLLAAESARALGRRVFVVPGSPDEPRAAGCLRLLRSGASVCTHSDDLLRALESAGPLFDPRERASTTDSHARTRKRSRARTSHARVVEPATAPRERSAAWSLDDDARVVYESLSSVGRHLDELARATGLPAASVRTSAMTLVLLGLAHDGGDGTFRLP